MTKPMLSYRITEDRQALYDILRTVYSGLPSELNSQAVDRMMHILLRQYQAKLFAEEMLAKQQSS